jgi:hypothetical protein
MRASAAVMYLSPYVTATGSFTYAVANAYTGARYNVSGFLAEVDCGCKAVVAGGDSGGPVISFNGSGQAVARGIVSGGIQPVSCPSWVPSSGYPCGWAIIVADINPMLSSHVLDITP